MSFEKVPASQAVDDALKGDMIHSITFNAITKELRGWKLHMMQANDRQLPNHFIRRVKAAFGMQLDAVAHHAVQDIEGAKKHSRDAAAIIAMSRLARLVVPIWSSFELGTEPELIRAGTEYTETPQGKRLIDMCEGVYLADTYGLTVHRDKLALPPFECPDLPNQGDEWFVDRAQGLYVAARTPAETSPVLRNELSLSVGGLAAADALIDAPNSVTLLPYLSYRHMHGRQI